MELTETALSIFALPVATDTDDTEGAQQARLRDSQMIENRSNQNLRGSMKTEGAEWAFSRVRDPKRLPRIEIVLSTWRELQSLRRETDDQKPTVGQFTTSKSTSPALKRVPISDAQLRAAFDKEYQKAIKKDSESVMPPDNCASRQGLIAAENELEAGAEPVDETNPPGEHTTVCVKEEPMEDIMPTRNIGDELTDEQIRDALASIKNSDAKIKTDLMFSDRILYRRIQKIGLEIYPVEDSVNKYFLFSRYYFSNRYGGSFVATFPTMSEEKLKEHKINDWAFLSLEYNPHAPQVPGAPGLFYAPQVPGAPGLFYTPAGKARRSWTSRVFVRLDCGKWLYVGKYTFAPSDSLTPEEFVSQPDRIRRTWAKEIKAHSTWGSNILARVYFRRQYNGREPTKDELKEVSFNKAALNSVTEQEIVDAFSTGKEVFSVWSMKCIGHDAKWIAELIEDYPKWLEDREAQLKKKKKAKVGGKASNRRASKKAPKPSASAQQFSKAAEAGTKRKAEVLDSISSSEERERMHETLDDDDVEDIEDDDGVQLEVAKPIYVPKRTRQKIALEIRRRRRR